MAAPVIGLRPQFSPSTRARVDWTHPLAQRLEFCYAPSVSALSDIAKNYSATPTGTPNLTSTPFGVGMRFANTRLEFNDVPDAPFLGALTVVWVGQASAIFAYGIAYKTTGPSNAFDTPFSLSITGLGNLTLRRANATTGTTLTISTALTAGSYGVLVFPVNRQILTSTPVTPTFNERGALITPAANVISFTGTNSPLTIGNTSASSDLTTSLLAVWSRTFSASEARALYADPFCFLKV